jgi:hypothetical protein
MLSSKTRTLLASFQLGAVKDSASQEYVFDDCTYMACSLSHLESEIDMRVRVCLPACFASKGSPCQVVGVWNGGGNATITKRPEPLQHTTAVPQGSDTAQGRRGSDQRMLGGGKAKCTPKHPHPLKRARNRDCKTGSARRVPQR